MNEAAGATGAVGKEIVGVLEKRGFPVKELHLFGSERSSGKFVDTKWGKVEIEAFSVQKAREMDVVFISVSGDFSKEYAKAIAEGYGALACETEGERPAGTMERLSSITLPRSATTRTSHFASQRSTLMLLARVLTRSSSKAEVLADHLPLRSLRIPTAPPPSGSWLSSPFTRGCFRLLLSPGC
eukprot:765026-Hanusia_phi.AAC.5